MEVTGGNKKHYSKLVASALVLGSQFGLVCAFTLVGLRNVFRTLGLLMGLLRVL